jgi:hypothetical protein
MDKKKVSKPKVKKPKVPKKKVPKSKSKVKKIGPSKKIQHKGGSDNIGNTTVGLFKSFFSFGQNIFGEIDLLTKSPGQLGKIAN